MKLRQTIILEEAMKLWAYPKTDFMPETKPENIHSLFEDFDYTNYGIRSYSMMGTIYKVLDWTDTMIGVVKTLFELDKSAVESAASNNDNVFISDTKQSYGKFVKIAENVYINKNTNTNIKVKLMQYLFDECDLDQNELLFNIYLNSNGN
jgi:hypothetical protein